MIIIIISITLAFLFAMLGAVSSFYYESEKLEKIAIIGTFSCFAICMIFMCVWFISNVLCN